MKSNSTNESTDKGKHNIGVAGSVVAADMRKPVSVLLLSCLGIKNGLILIYFYLHIQSLISEMQKFQQL